MHPAGDVQLVRWPQEADTRRRLAAGGERCLLVVEPTMLPPEDLQPGEDWVRSTADPVEVGARLDRLRSLRPGRAPRPTVDADGIVSFGGRWTAMGPIDVELAQLLCDHFGSLVSRRELRACFQPLCSDANLTVKLYRLRRQFEKLGLTLATVRGRGYVLDVADAVASPGGATG